jgi:histidyl-tRNA synthetase
MNNQKQKISTEPYKGVRDFFPEDMFVQNYIFDKMKDTVKKFGYVEYGASVLEAADLYRAKSGEEIVNEQTYNFIDRGGREVAMRPEMTPTLARMIAARRRELPTPIRWFSIPNLFRYENPQRGRLREHWQLNVDIFGVKGIEAETEVISVAHELMKSFGFKDNDFEVRINSRKITDYIIRDEFALNEEDGHKIVKLLDRKAKLPKETFDEEVKLILGDRAQAFFTILNSKNFEEFVTAIPSVVDFCDCKGEVPEDKKEMVKAIAEIRELMASLEALGIGNVVFDQTIMRGFDYYTGIVFEIFDNNPANKRAVFGGGRYDDLLALFGNDKVPAVGFGTGDVIIRDLMETYGTLPKYENHTKLYICLAEQSAMGYAQETAQDLREQNISVAIDYSGKKIGDQIKAADKMGIPYIVVMGEEEVKTGQLKIKNIQTGDEKVVSDSEIAGLLK